MKKNGKEFVVWLYIKKVYKIKLVLTVQIYNLDRLGKILQHNSCRVHDERVCVYSVDHGDKILDRTKDNLLIYFQDRCVKMDILYYGKHLNKIKMFNKIQKICIKLINTDSK